VELVEEDLDASTSSVHRSTMTTTPRLVLPPSEHLQTIDEKTGDVSEPDLQVPTAETPPSPSDSLPKNPTEFQTDATDRAPDRRCDFRVPDRRHD